MYKLYTRIFLCIHVLVHMPVHMNKYKRTTALIAYIFIFSSHIWHIITWHCFVKAANKIVRSNVVFSDRKNTIWSENECQVLVTTYSRILLFENDKSALVMCSLFTSKKFTLTYKAKPNGILRSQKHRVVHLKPWVTEENWAAKDWHSGRDNLRKFAKTRRLRNVEVREAKLKVSCGDSFWDCLGWNLTPQSDSALKAAFGLFFIHYYSGIP